jgi:hypothetical protein
VVPDLPQANYDVWARGYGLIDSDKTKSTPGKIVRVGAWRTKESCEPLLDNPRRLGKGRARLVGPAPLVPALQGVRAGRQDSPVPLAAFARRQ